MCCFPRDFDLLHFRTLLKPPILGLFSAYIGRTSAYIGSNPGIRQTHKQAQDLAKNFFGVFDPFSRNHNLLCAVSLGKQRKTQIRTPKNPLIGAYAGVMQEARQAYRQVRISKASYKRLSLKSLF